MSTPQDPPQYPQFPHDGQTVHRPPSEPSAPYTPPPAYGQPNPYGASYAQPAYGGGYPPAPQQPASKGMAIVALILSIVGCGIGQIVSIVLASLVLRKSKSTGQNHGRGMAIAALIISVLSLLLGAAAVVFAVLLGGTSVADLKTGDCITANGLDDSSDPVSAISVVPCSQGHDGEVVATVDVTQEQVDSYGADMTTTVCTDAASDDVLAAVAGGELTLLGVSQTLPPEAGDPVACVVYNADGSSLDGPIGE